MDKRLGRNALAAQSERERGLQGVLHVGKAAHGGVRLCCSLLTREGPIWHVFAHFKAGQQDGQSRLAVADARFARRHGRLPALELREPLLQEGLSCKRGIIGGSLFGTCSLGHRGSATDARSCAIVMCGFANRHVRCPIKLWQVHGRTCWVPPQAQLHAVHNNAPQLPPSAAAVPPVPSQPAAATGARPASNSACKCSDQV